ncbi:hypothetical protein HK101_003069 [Irineochytrium annulatum]|nr:hypothetical protein HK101_003069 [Irineochytrium annulatum]
MPKRAVTFTQKFAAYPIFLTTWHLIFSTFATRVLANTTNLLDGRHKVVMDMPTYVRSIVPIGVFFSLSLITQNQAYLYLSVSFIQMLKATTPVAVLISTAVLTQKPIDMKILANVSIIVVGIMIASYGEIEFVVIGVIFQMVGIVFESIRLVMVQLLLNGSNIKMDPLTSVYFFAPVCAAMNFIMCCLFERAAFDLEEIAKVGFATLFFNACVAFALNVAVVFLIGKTSSLVFCLSGVLKDIILVVCSILIFGTPVTPLQFFGYSIALGGLVAYKSGGLPSYQEVVGNAQNRRIAAGVALFISVFVTVLFITGGGEGTHSPGGRSVDVVRGVSYKTRNGLDVVMAYFNEEAQGVADVIAELRRTPEVLARHPKFIIYNKGEVSAKELKKLTGADDVIQLANFGREGATYLHHIMKHYNSGLARWTLFSQAEPMPADALLEKVKGLTEKTGFLTLKFFEVCQCEECYGSFPRVSELYSLVSGKLCPNTGYAASMNGQFVVSAKRIHSVPLEKYEYLQSVLNSEMDHFIHMDDHWLGDTKSNPFFGHILERSWSFIFNCSDIKMVGDCPLHGDSLTTCQCEDK